MTKIEQVHNDMIMAMKNKETEKKNTLSMLLNALKTAEKENRTNLTSEQENQVVLRMCKQIKETIDTCPVSRIADKEKAEQEYKIVSEYAPKLMSEEEIKIVITETLKEIGIEIPTVKDKGKIMKVLMPKVKGKADGKLVNTILSNMFV